MKRKNIDLAKHMPRHAAMKVLAVLLASVGLVGLWGSLTHADLVIQSTLENAIQTIKELHITSDGSPNNIDRVRLDQNGVYIHTGALGGPNEGVLKISNNGYIIRDLVQGTNIANDSIDGSHIISGSIMTGHLGFPYPISTNPGINIGCPSGEVMAGVNNGLPICTPIAAGSIDCGLSGYVQGWSSTGLVICGFGNQNPFTSTGINVWHLITGTNNIYYGTPLEDNDGNVGIGLNAPTAKLHVQGDLKVDTLNGSFIVSSGRVGINTSLPQANLDVSGSVRFASYGGIANRALGVDINGMIVASSGALWMQSGSALYILNTNVGIGTHTPTDKLQVIGNVRANSFLTNSDITLKKNIQPLTNSLSKIITLKPVSYDLKADNSHQIGFIAQDIEKIFPEVVVTDNQGIKSLAYANLVAPLAQSIKELYETMLNLTEQYNRNEQRISSLEKQMYEMEKLLLSK